MRCEVVKRRLYYQHGKNTTDESLDYDALPEESLPHQVSTIVPYWSRLRCDANCTTFLARTVRCVARQSPALHPAQQRRECPISKAFQERQRNFLCTCFFQHRLRLKLPVPLRTA